MAKVSLRDGLEVGGGGWGARWVEPLRKGLEVHDQTKRVHASDAPGKPISEELKLDGGPLYATNDHKILAGAKISGIVDLSSVWASSIRISVPMAIKCLFLEMAPPRAFSGADVLGDKEDL